MRFLLSLFLAPLLLITPAQAQIAPSVTINSDAVKLDNSIIIDGEKGFLSLQNETDVKVQDQQPAEKTDTQLNKKYFAKTQTNARLNFVNMTLKGDDFSEQDIKSALFTNSTLEDINFKGADLSYANFANVKFINCDLTDAKVNNANFINAKFENTKTTNVDFSTATTINVDFGKAP